MKRNILFLIPLLLTCMIFTLVSCSSNDYIEVRLNEVVHSIFYAPQYVALENGYFNDEGLNVTVDTGWGADKSMTALLSNNADIALMGPESSIYVYNEGKENHAISFAQLTQRAGNFLISREEDNNFSWDNVKGKTIIGGRPGGMPQMVLEYILKQNDITPFDDVNIITNIQFTATAGSFVSGTGNYTTEFEPTASTLEDEGNGHVVASLGTASGNVPYTTYMATKEYINDNPNAIQKFTNALYKGQKWVNEHTPSEIAEVIQPYFKDTDKKLLTKIIKRYKSQDTWCETPVFEKEGFDLLKDILKEAGELDIDTPYEDLVTNEFSRKSVE